MRQPRIRILAWNVLYRDLEARTEGLAATIAGVKADIVLLQETNPHHAELMAQQLGMTVVGCGPEAPTGGVTSVPAVLARIDNVDPVPGSGVILTDETKTYAVVHGFVVGSHRLVAASVHLTHTSQAGRMALDQGYVAAAQGLGPVDAIGDASIRDSVAARLGQIEPLTTIVDELAVEGAAVVLGGDFNFVPRGPEYQRLLGFGYADAWEAGPRLGSRDTIIEHNPLIGDGVGVYDDVSDPLLVGATGPHDYTLDFHFISGLRCQAAWVIGRPDPLAPEWHSDHLGVAGDYEIASDGGAPVA